MEYIAHRVNTIKELDELDTGCGVELDLRDNVDGSIYISHNPFESGENFEKYLQHYHHGTMIANIKSERIEDKVIELMEQYDVKNYFFLDSTFPMIKLLSDRGNRNIALRYSEYEGIDTIENMQGKVDWIWVDTFTKMPLNHESYIHMKNMGYKLCLVSPELQGQPEKIDAYKKLIDEENIKFDAICTKSYNIHKWKG